jgi:hypothetical protein
MDDWLARWADDVGHPKRTMCITRRTDGRQVRIVGTLGAYGFGVDTAIQIEKIEHEGRTVRPLRSTPDEIPPSTRGAVHEILSVARKQPGVLKRRASR